MSPRIENVKNIPNYTNGHFSSNMSIVFNLSNITLLCSTADLEDKERGIGIQIYRIIEALIQIFCLGEDIPL